jgi:chemotaxis protein CheD
MEYEGKQIVLGPGDLYFGEAPGELYTLLGSCVAVTLWHPRILVGGMCHIVLPDKPENVCDNRYAICAVEQFNKDVKHYGTRPNEYRVGIYGGGNMFPSVASTNKMQIGQRNIEKMHEMMEKYGFNLREFHVGGTDYRRVSLDLTSGEVVVSGQDVRIHRTESGGAT